MPVRTESWPVGTPCWADLTVPDIEAAKSFYGPVLGWEFSGGSEEFGGYVNCSSNGALVAGLSPMFQAGAPAAWTTYFASTDAAGTTERIETAGGTVFMPPMQVMDMGTMVVAADPGGATFGVWQSGTHTGFGLYREPGTVIWEELSPGEGGAAGAKDFYASVFDLQFEHVPGGYTFKVTEPIDTESIGSIGSPEVEVGTPHWQLWFMVADVDAAAATAVQHGGKVMTAPANGDQGREARLLDPAGAELFVIGSAT